MLQATTLRLTIAIACITLYTVVPLHVFAQTAGCYDTVTNSKVVCVNDNDVASCNSICNNTGKTCLLINSDPTCSTPASPGAQSTPQTSSTGAPQPQKLQNPLAVSSITQIVGIIIKMFLGISGSIALLMFVWGGGHWIFSGGKSENIESGKKIITWATIGFVIILTSYFVLSLIFNILGA